MKISILKLARDDLKEIHEYLSDFGEIPPRKFRESFEKFCSQVLIMPNMHKQYPYNPIYRKAIIAYDYSVYYQADEKNGTIKIFRVLHGKRNVEFMLLT